MMKKLSQRDIDAFVAAQHAEIYGYVENIPADARQRKIRGDVTPPLSPDTGRAFAQFFQEFYENQLFNGEASPTESFFLSLWLSVSIFQVWKVPLSQQHPGTTFFCTNPSEPITHS